MLVWIPSTHVLTNNSDGGTPVGAGAPCMTHCTVRYPRDRSMVRSPFLVAATRAAEHNQRESGTSPYYGLCPGSLSCNLGGATRLSSEQRAPGGEAEAKESEEDSGGISRRTRLDIAPAPWHRLCSGHFLWGDICASKRRGTAGRPLVLRNRPHRVAECAVEAEASVRRPWRRRPPPMMHRAKHGSLWHVVAEPRVELIFVGEA